VKRHNKRITVGEEAYMNNESGQSNEGTTKENTGREYVETYDNVQRGCTEMTRGRRRPRLMPIP
jgi:hypothetical protein